VTLLAQPLDISPPGWAWRSAGRGLLSLGKMGGIFMEIPPAVMDKRAKHLTATRPLVVKQQHEVGLLGIYHPIHRNSVSNWIYNMGT